MRILMQVKLEVSSRQIPAFHAKKSWLCYPTAHACSPFDNWSSNGPILKATFPFNFTLYILFELILTYFHPFNRNNQ